MKNREPEILAVISLGLAVFLLVHQQLTSDDAWFNVEEFFDHHESPIAVFLVAAIALLVGKYLGRQ